MRCKTRLQPILTKATNAEDLSVFTTRPDTLFGVTYVAVAPESAVVDDLIASAPTDAYRQAVQEFVSHVKRLPKEARAKGDSSSGVFTGLYAIHPLTHAQVTGDPAFSDGSTIS